MNALLTGGCLVLSTLVAADLTGQITVDAKLPRYEKVPGVSGNINSIGSETMSNLMAHWAEGFQRVYPNVVMEIEGKGSATAPPALIEGTSIFGPMSRPMKGKEIDEFENEFGYKPVELAAAIDMLAVYVHKDNPIAKQGLTIQQVDAIFSKTRRGGERATIRTWGQLGLTGAWADQPISLYGRNSASGTYGFFKEKALFGGDYKDTVKEQPGSASVVQGVANDRYGIGYSGIGSNTADVVSVPIAKKPGAKFIQPAPQNMDSYALSRFLYVALNYKPGSRLDPLRREFVRMVYSREGQEIVVKDGYLPVPFAIAKRNLSTVGVALKPARAAEASSGR